MICRWSSVGWPAGYAAAAVLAAMMAATPAAASEYALAPGQSVVGSVGEYVVKQGEVFADIARRFDVGYTALAAANPGVDPWLPGAGRRLRIPSLYVLPAAPHQGIVVNLAQGRLFYFPPGGGQVETHPLGLGVIGRRTPLGETRVVRKQANPTWYPPADIRAEHRAEGDDLPAVVPPGPDNPLGAFALYLGWPDYRIHGTNKPDGVGRNVSHGCIRLYPEDIERLFGEVAVGTPVRTVRQPATAGWQGDALYVEVYPSKSQIDQIDTERRVTPEPVAGVHAIVAAAAGQYKNAVDWGAVDRAASTRSGVPVAVASLAGGPVANRSPEPDETAPDDDTGGSVAPAAPPAYDRRLPYGLRENPYGGRGPAQYGQSAASPAYDPDAPYDRATDAARDPYDRTAVDPFRDGNYGR